MSMYAKNEEIEWTVTQAAVFLNTNRQQIQNMVKDQRIVGRYVGDKAKRFVGKQVRLPIVIHEPLWRMKQLRAELS